MGQKFGNRYWMMTLRDAGAMPVPVGNEFSGLWGSIIAPRNPHVSQVRRPHAQERSHSRRIPSQVNRARKNLEGLGALQKRARQLQRSMKVVRRTDRQHGCEWPCRRSVYRF